MKIEASKPGRAWRGGEMAVTLPEMMIALSLLVMVIAAMVVTHLFGMRFFEITKAKLVASDDGRRLISRVVSDIRGAKMIRIGDGTLDTFTEVPDGSPQQGSALQIYASTNTNTFIRYFWNSADGRLKRSVDGESAADLMASCITNSAIFTSEDFTGRILTNNQNNRVIGMTLRIYQLQYPIVTIGSGYYYDFYQLRTRITRRALE